MSIAPARIDDLLWNFDWNHQTLLRLVGDVDDAEMARQPVPGINHAAWVVGHLCCYHPVIVAMLKGESFDNPWEKPCGKNSTPVDDRSAYPAKSELLGRYEQGHNEAVAAIKAATAESFAASIQHDTWGKQLPDVGRAVGFLCTSHFAYHVGQLSGWRRAMQLPRA